MWHTRSPDETRERARAWAATLADGDVVALIGELGAGKTCFVQGLAAGCGVTEPVTSPTYTLVHEYRGTRPLTHIDLYRVGSVPEALDLGLDEYAAGPGVTVLEWADRVASWLPARAWEVRLAAGERPDDRHIALRRWGAAS